MDIYSWWNGRHNSKCEHTFVRILGQSLLIVEDRLEETQLSVQVLVCVLLRGENKIWFDFLFFFIMKR